MSGTERTTELSRRRMLGVAGTAGAGLVVVGCARRPPGPGGGTTPPGGGGACPLTPEQSEGPYYLDAALVRTDITEGHPGAPVTLAVTVVDGGCEPRPGAAVDIWHADAAGNYSGFGAGRADRTFLRGIQTTDATGACEFRTIYPGWYVGRAIHIHVKVHVGGNVIHTGQLYFDEALNDRVMATAPYAVRTGTRTLNSQDFIYRNGGAQSTVAMAPEGGGYRGTVRLAVV